MPSLTQLTQVRPGQNSQSESAASAQSVPERNAQRDNVHAWTAGQWKRRRVLRDSWSVGSWLWLHVVCSQPAGDAGHSTQTSVTAQSYTQVMHALHYMYQHIIVNTYYIYQSMGVRKVSNGKGDLWDHSKHRNCRYLIGHISLHISVL